MSKEKTLSDRFHDTLKDIYFAEKKTNDALTKLAESEVNEHAEAAE